MSAFARVIRLDTCGWKWSRATDYCSKYLLLVAINKQRKAASLEDDWLLGPNQHPQPQKPKIAGLSAASSHRLTTHPEGFY